MLEAGAGGDNLSSDGVSAGNGGGVDGMTIGANSVCAELKRQYGMHQTR